MASTQSTYTGQSVYDDLVAKGDLNPGWDVAGYTVRPIISILNSTFEQICGGEGMFPWKWNQILLPLFVYNSWQQDYALLGPAGKPPVNGSASLTNLSWLQEGVGVDINNPSMPKPWTWCKVGRNQSRSTSAYVSNSAFVQPLCGINWLPNNQLYYGTWGAAQTGNATWGNNPQANQVITNPLASGASMPKNPITQIQDANGNFLVLTQYGTLGTTAPVAPANSLAGVQATPGSGDTTIWTVIDPYGQGVRIAPAPSQTGTVWQINLLGQAKPVQFTDSSSLKSQSLFPLTDDFYQRFMDGATAECYRYNPNAKIRANYAKANELWIKSLMALRRQSDREAEFYRIKPARTIIGAGGQGQGGNLGPFWPFGYPVS
jgi:hypothetical protein